MVTWTPINALINTPEFEGIMAIKPETVDAAPNAKVVKKEEGDEMVDVKVNIKEENGDSPVSSTTLSPKLDQEIIQSMQSMQFNFNSEERTQLILKLRMEPSPSPRARLPRSAAARRLLLPRMEKLLPRRSGPLPPPRWGRVPCQPRGKMLARRTR